MAKIKVAFIKFGGMANGGTEKYLQTIAAHLPKDEFVSITIYDLLGNVINNLVNTNQSSGYRSVQWNATNNQGQPVAAGVYFYSIEAGKFRQTKKMILLK